MLSLHLNKLGVSKGGVAKHCGEVHSEEMQGPAIIGWPVPPPPVLAKSEKKVYDFVDYFMSFVLLYQKSNLVLLNLSTVIKTRLR
jgi:hypothetical protein